MLKKMLFPAAVAMLSLAQIPATQQYVATDTITSSSGESFTVLLPASSNRTVVPGTPGQTNIQSADPTMFWGSVSAAATVCLYTGTAAVTGTAASVTSYPGNGGAPRQAIAYTGSNGSGSSLGCVTLPSAGPFSFTGIYLYKQAPGIQTLTITITPSTGTVSGYVNGKWSEQ